MQTVSSKSCRLKQEKGFTIFELMVVVAIIGILATLVKVSFDSQAGKVKSVVLNLRGDMNFARSEAVSRNRNVRVDFFFDDDLVPANLVDLDIPADGTPDDGYRIWIDDDADSIFDNNFVDANGNGICEMGEGDCVLKQVAFPAETQFFDQPAATDGPNVSPSGAPPPFDPGDGVSLSLGVNWLAFLPDGTCNRNGTIYIYAPSSEGAEVMKAPPLAMVISTTTGRVRVMRWRVASKSWETR